MSFENIVLAGIVLTLCYMLFKNTDKPVSKKKNLNQPLHKIRFISEQTGEVIEMKLIDKSNKSQKQFNEETSFEKVPKFWDEYYEKGYQNVVPPMLGICINNNECLEFEYGIGSLKEYCSEIPEGFKQINIPEHLWGKFYTKGKMPTTIQKLWKEVIEWVHSSEYEIAANYDFECYSEGDSDSNDYVSGIWVPLKLKK